MEYDPLHPDNWSDEEEYYEAIAAEYPPDYETQYMIEVRNIEQAREAYNIALNAHMRIWRIHNPQFIGFDEEIELFRQSYYVSSFNTGQ